MARLSLPVAGKYPRRSTQTPYQWGLNGPYHADLPTHSVFLSIERGRKDRVFARWLLDLVWIISSLGLHQLYFHHLTPKHARPGNHSNIPYAEVEGTLRSSASICLRQEWSLRTITGTMLGILKCVSAASALVLAVSIKLLQGNAAKDNTFSRMSALSAVVFSSSAIASSAFYLSGKIDFTSEKMEAKWKEALMTPRIGVEFSACLFLPVSSVIWSGICVVMSAISIACPEGGNLGSPSHGSSLLLSGAPAYNILFAMISVSMAQIFRAVMVLTK